MAAAPKIVEPLRVGVIGLGFFGRRHAGIYAAHPAAELVGVCDIDEQAREEIVGRTGAAAHATHEELLARDDLDAVSVCLPDRHHEAAAIAVAQAGKAMLLEKPLAHTTDAARRIVEAVEGAGTRLMVGHILRFDPRYAQLHTAAAPERIGTPIHLRAERMGIRSIAERLGPASSILFYMGVHDWERRCKRCRNGAGPESSPFWLVVTVEVRCRCPWHAMRAYGVLPLGLPQF